MKRTRNVMFTSWDVEFQLDPSSWDACSYAVWQTELSPQTGKLHYQGYAEFTRAVNWGTLHGYPGLDEPPAHFESRRGSQKAAMAYCSKAETRCDGPYIFGEPCHQGQRTELVQIATEIHEGRTLREISRDHPGEYIKLSSGIHRYKHLHTEPRSWAMEIYLILGTTGCGKTRFAHTTFSDAYWKPKGKWWDGYDGQSTVIIDEMYGHNFSFTELLQLLDRYPHSVEIKGSSVQFVSHTIVMTSNRHPGNWYSAIATHQATWDAENPLKRRLDEFCETIYLTPCPMVVPVLIAPGEPQAPMFYGRNEAEN